MELAFPLEPDHQAITAPKLDVMICGKALGLLDCLGVACADERLAAYDMAVDTDRVGSILCHGRSLPTNGRAILAPVAALPTLNRRMSDRSRSRLLRDGWRCRIEQLGHGSYYLGWGEGLAQQQAIWDAKGRPLISGMSGHIDHGDVRIEFSRTMS
jgi:hypothetical protein